ncbi:alpha/beta hydrolase [uncultured Marixanthomonas sp.]|uniref:alpha/beta fold hydrolase n=1 Tax=uncultured Marixanthomonas sp. TaxID=757245 RepID=UPI0030DDB1A0|tara:strand:+ start:68249 stop:69127 length:879 start_codon:yes stop_codon:yes gene_type:complete
MIKSRNKSLDRLLFVKLIFFCCITFLSCTTLQYRKTDTEIIEGFKEKGVLTELSFFQVDSLNLNIRIQKVALSNEEINVVFFHGSPSSLTAWHAYMADKELAQAANLYAIDRPGYGYSNFGDEMPSIERQAELMNAAVSDLQLDNIIVVGTSYGGPLAARLAVINQNVKGVILLSAAMDPQQEKDIWASRLTQWWVTRWLVPTGYRVAGDEKSVHAAELSKIEQDWHTLKIPIVHFHGSKDNVVPVGNIKYTDSIFSNSTVTIIPNVGHNLAWEHIDIVKPEILKFIEVVFK